MMLVVCIIGDKFNWIKTAVTCFMLWDEWKGELSSVYATYIVRVVVFHLSYNTLEIWSTTILSIVHKSNNYF